MHTDSVYYTTERIQRDPFPYVPHVNPAVEHPALENGRESIDMPLGWSLDDVERTYVLRTLESCRGNKSRASKSLGISRKTLYDMLNRWGKSVAAQ